MVYGFEVSHRLISLTAVDRIHKGSEKERQMRMECMSIYVDGGKQQYPNQDVRSGLGELALGVTRWG